MQKKHTDQSERVKKRKYHHRLSRKGYVGLQEEEVYLFDLFYIYTLGLHITVSVYVIYFEILNR